MIGPRLVVATPRGGEAGHRFLTSRNDTGDLELASVNTKATQKAVGRSYISVSRQVTQRLPNGAVREGVERMILVGIDVDQLQSEQIEQVKSELSKLLPALDTLIASMDWPSGNRSTVILCEELRNWVAGEVFAHLPLSELTVAGSFHKSVTPLRSIKNWLLIATLLAACGGIIWLSSGRQGGQTEGGKDSTPPTPPTNETRVKKLADAWKCSTEELVRSLKRANNWDHRREADVLSLKAGLADGDVLTMLTKVEASSGSNQFFVSPDIEDAGFRRFIERSSLSAVEMKDRRKWLYFAFEKLNLLKGAADKANDALGRLETKDAVVQMLISVAIAGTDAGMEDSFQQPATPLLDRQDLMIYRLLNQYPQRWSPAGFELKIAEGDNGVAKDELAQFMTGMQYDREKLCKKIVESRKDVVDTVREKQGKESADKVYDVYVSFAEFIAQLSMNPAGSP